MSKSPSFSKETLRRMSLIVTVPNTWKWSTHKKYLAYGHKEDKNKVGFEGKACDDPADLSQIKYRKYWESVKENIKSQYPKSEDFSDDIYRFMDADGGYREPPLPLKLSNITLEPDASLHGRLRSFLKIGAGMLLLEGEKAWSEYEAELYVILNAMKENIKDVGLKWVQKEVDDEMDFLETLKKDREKREEAMKRRKEGEFEEETDEATPQPIKPSVLEENTKEWRTTDGSFRIPVEFQQHIPIHCVGVIVARLSDDSYILKDFDRSNMNRNSSS